MKLLVIKSYTAPFVSWTLFTSAAVSALLPVNEPPLSTGQNITSSRFAGAFQQSNCAVNGKVTQVSAIWTIPKISVMAPDPIKYDLDMAVGIGGYSGSCSSPATWAGVTMGVVSDLNVITALAFWTVYTSDPVDYHYFNYTQVIPGDKVQVTVSVSAGNPPSYQFDNLSLNLSSFAQADSTPDLCQQYAFFSTQNPTDPSGTPTPLAFFPTFSMENCTVLLEPNSQTCGLNNATVVDLAVGENLKVTSSIQSDTEVQFVRQ